jgi:hypothetical protein
VLSREHVSNPERTPNPVDAYDAFFSYTSGADNRLVRSTERYLEGFHRQLLLRRLKLRPLTICVDGSDIRPRFGDAIESVDTTLRRYLAVSGNLVVFCSPATAHSTYVNGEVVAFLETHSAGAVIPVLVSGEPAGSFPPALLERGYAEAIWLDFRGARLWWWQRRTRRVRIFSEERVRLAAFLHEQSPAILPAWKRAQAIRRVVSSAAAMLFVIATWTAISQLRVTSGHTVARTVIAAIENGGASIDALQTQSAIAVSRVHDTLTDAAFRQSRALSLLRLALPTALVTGNYAVNRHDAIAARVSDRGLEITADIRAGNWRLVAAGPFSAVAMSDDGGVIAAGDDRGVQVWRDGALVRCAGWPSAGVARGIAVDPTGTSVAAVVAAAAAVFVVVGQASECPSRPLRVLPWPSSTSRAAEAVVTTSTEYRRGPVALSAGGGTLIASVDRRWLLATIPPGDGALVPLNDRLLDVWRRQFPPDSAGATRPITVTDATFAADGRYALVAAEIEGLAGRLAPPLLAAPLHDGSEPIVVADSRGTRRVTVATKHTVVAFAKEAEVRVSDWLQHRDVMRLRTRGNVSALTYTADDRVLVLAEQAEHPRLSAVDAATGAVLTRASAGDVPIDAVESSGGQRPTVLVYAANAAAPALFDVRAPDVRRQLHKYEEHLSSGALLPGGGVAVTGNSGVLEFVRGIDQTPHEIRLQSPGVQLAAARDAVYVLSADRRVTRCPLAAVACDEPRSIGGAGGIAVDDADRLRILCAARQIVGERDRCSAPARPAPVGQSQALAVSAGRVLIISEDGVCVAAESPPGPCVALPYKEKPVLGALSSRGDVAVTVRVDNGSRIDLYGTATVRWFPRPAQGYVRRSEIVVPGDLIALSFSTDATHIRAASTWGGDVVTACFPVTADAMRADATDQDTTQRCADE